MTRAKHQMPSGGGNLNRDVGAGSPCHALPPVQVSPPVSPNRGQEEDVKKSIFDKTMAREEDLENLGQVLNSETQKS